MKSLMKNLEREKAILILDWCKAQFGRSQYHRKYPTLRLYRSRGNSAFSDNDPDAGLFGTYINGVITVYLGSHTGMKQLCATIIHEYKHYLLSIREYRSLSRYMENQGSDLEDISWDHPHELECREFEKIWTEKCFSQLRKKLYSKS